MVWKLSNFTSIKFPKGVMAGAEALITRLLFEAFNKGCPCQKHNFIYRSLHCLGMLMSPDIGRNSHFLKCRIEFYV